MTDVLTVAQRSYNMSRIRSSETGPEILLHSLLISRGLSDFEIQPKTIFGRPDFYFYDRRSAVFVDGCFWHGCSTCFHAPQTNKKFWNSKIKSNIMRDEEVNKTLADGGIEVIRVKEHELKQNPEDIINKIEKTLPPDKRPKVLDLFAGAGGLSEGFIQAGCEIVSHIEADKKACSTLITRMIYHALKKKNQLDDYKNYILGKITRDALVKKHGLQKAENSVICEKIGENNYKELITKVQESLNGEKLDIIVGGPPCQAYSHIGRARDDKNMRQDERNFLYKYYIEFLKALNVRYPFL